MAQLINEPRAEQVDLEDWMKILLKTTIQAGGFTALGLTNMNNTGAPQIANGSRVEVGGSLYKCMADETIGGTPAAGVNYIYCNPAGSAAGFTYSATAPQWNAVKGSWYNGNSRAVAKLFYTSGQYNGKVILDSYNAIRAVNMEQEIPETGGVTVSIPGYSENTKKTYRFTLPPGAYRYTLTSGAGAGDADGQTGGVAKTRNSVSGTFIWRGGPIVIKTGGNGFNGGNGGNEDNTFYGPAHGGGSGAGEKSEIWGVAETDRVDAGKSGSGQMEGQAGVGGAGGAAGPADDHHTTRSGSYGKNGVSYGYGNGGGGDGIRGNSGGNNSNGDDGGDGGNSGGGANGTNVAGKGPSGGGGGGDPGWMRKEGGPGGSASLTRVF